MLSNICSQICSYAYNITCYYGRNRNTYTVISDNNISDIENISTHSRVSNDDLRIMISGLCKDYDSDNSGVVRVLSHINANLYSGSITSLLGSNGAGAIHMYKLLYYLLLSIE